MPIEPAVKRAVVFVDGQNLFHAAREAFGYTYPNFDVLALSLAVCQLGGWELAQARFYTGVPSAEDNAFWSRFWQAKLAAMGRQKRPCGAGGPGRCRTARAGEAGGGEGVEARLIHGGELLVGDLERLVGEAGVDAERRPAAQVLAAVLDDLGPERLEGNTQGQADSSTAATRAGWR